MILFSLLRLRFVAEKFYKLNEKVKNKYKIFFCFGKLNELGILNIIHAEIHDTNTHTCTW